MSLLEMDFDTQEVSIQGDNGQLAVIELGVDEAKELADWFMEIYNELLKGVTDDQSAGVGFGNDGQRYENGPYNGDRCSLMGSGNEEAADNDKQLSLFPGVPATDEGDK